MDVFEALRCCCTHCGGHKTSRKFTQRTIFALLLVLASGVRINEASQPHTINNGYASDIEDNNVPRELPPTDECAILNQIQSVVIQILGTHYEYGQGIHTLHRIVDGVQDDFSVLKNELTEVSKQVYSSAYRNYTKYKSRSQQAGNDVPTFDSRDPEPISRSLQAAQWTLRNLTNKVNLQSQQYHALDKKYVRLRRKLKKVLEGPGGPRGQTKVEEKGMIVDHYMDKQTDINTKLLRRIQHLEQRLRVEDDQRDAPEMEHFDGCPPRFIRHFSSCYKFCNDTKNWIDAEKTCQGYHQGAHIVAIETSEEAEFLVQYRIHNREHWGSNYIWTGGNDMTEEGVWRWVGTGDLLSYKNWRPGQPDNHNADQHCVYLRADGADPRWDDWHCHAARLNYVCEINMGSE